ncbi:sodium- and chloride-dependent glycine transporter 2-like [Paramacrobiotus metropolitanus]|uniref:sodium- and chloride-dependent glycine transporter 2-like n=1 Tax=Paramacrobiotus metropolitanus TaxID=2943436 RepID=UPI002445EFD6|nr:sodium- and chloride-dependent glycine transporter 2-like [Paramacrobiotus metropolitanus]
MTKDGLSLQHDEWKTRDAGISRLPVGLTAPDTGQDGRVPNRTRWSHKAEFVLACLSLSVGLGNVWRFPYIAYANGGGAFLLPYLILLLLCGKPMYFMEIAFGQYHQEGPVTIWKRVSPIAKGIGIGQVVIQLLTAMYYLIIMAWTMYYFWTTLAAACQGRPVPWSGDFCTSPWANEDSCIVLQKAPEINATDIPVVSFDTNEARSFKRFSSAQQYFDRVILMRYEQGGNESTKFGLKTSMGGINWFLTANLAGVSLLVFLSLVKGIKSAGKVVYVTSTLPFIVLIILLGIGVAQENSVEGILYFITPQFSKLLKINTWRDAAEQMFYSLSVGFGSLVTLGSYNQRNNNCYQDALIVSIADTLTSITAGLSLFAILGYLAAATDSRIESVAVSGPGLAFVTFPEAASLMWGSHFWAILFFLMLFTLGLGSQIGTLETVLTVFYDRWPSLRAKKPLMCGIFCFGCFILGLPFMLQGGLDLFDIIDSYAGGFSVLFTAFFEVVIIMWVYGLSRFIDDLKDMLGKRGDVGYYWRTTWGFLAPLTLFFILVLSFIFYAPLNHGDTLPEWADFLGWGLALSSIIQIPAFAVVVVWQTPGRTFSEKLHEAMWPREFLQNKTTVSPNEIPLSEMQTAKYFDNKRLEQ